MIALCSENKMREWEGSDWIRLESDGWINGKASCCFHLLDRTQLSFFVI